MLTGLVSDHLLACFTIYSGFLESVSKALVILREEASMDVDIRQLNRSSIQRDKHILFFTALLCGSV